MARMATIARLHLEPAPQCEQIKLPSVGNSQPDVSAPPPERTVRARFARRREEAETYALDAPADIMTSVRESVYVNRSDDFAVLAARERVAGLVRKFLPQRMEQSTWGRGPF